MKKIILCLLFITFIGESIQAQTFSRYIIKLKNKGSNPYTLNNPLQYLSQKAIDRRSRYGIAIDSTDLPVTPRYIDSIRLAGTVTILNVSKWLNSVTIQTTDQAAINKINSFPFVQTAAPIAARLNASPDRPKKQLGSSGTSEVTEAFDVNNIMADYYNYGLSANQIRIHNGQFLHNIGLRGQNMIIGMLDAGYRNYTTLRAFDSVRLSGRILETWDFVARESSVVEDNAHGMYCFSIMAANVPGQLVGTAPASSYVLYLTEDVASEYPIEEHNWVCGAERIDSIGGDLISSSLGYSDHMSNPTFDHTYADMNGNTTIAVTGADLAAKKGILVVNSAGNQGDEDFKYIATPADGDSVLAVGAVNVNGAVGSFSSYGPSADGRIKPDVASVGVSTYVWSTNNTTGSGNGTSFACPNLAGLAACLWQGFREYNNMKILNTLRQAGSIASAPNNRIGYGIPDVKKATMSLIKEFSTASGAVSNCKTTLNWTSKDMNEMKYEIERKAPGESNFTKIAERWGTGSIFNNQTYQYADTLINVPAGTITYRIRQIIDTASATLTADYIDTVTINSATACVTTSINPVNTSTEYIQVAPNPAYNSFILKVTTVAPVSKLTIRIVNAKGEMVSLLKKNKHSGTASFDIPIIHLAKGAYYISVYNNEKLISTKELIRL